MSLPLPPGWSPWKHLEPAWTCSPRVLAESLDGGQAFRWRLQADGPWEGRWADCLARVTLDDSSRVVWSAPESLGDATARVARYLGAGTDWDGLVDALPVRSDPVLRQAVAAFPGLRLLRQPFGETLLGFLCSSTKQIIQIRRMCDDLALRLGPPLPCGGHALPAWETIATADPAVLRACALGYRAAYIQDTARFLAAHPGWLDETERIPFAEARARLVTLPGVGPKIADCVLLFGAGRFESFPVDVWIIRAMSRLYDLEGWSPAQVAHFGRVHFGAAAGLAQQFLFSSIRGAGK